MIAVIQRVTQASVSVDNKTIGKINSGFLILLGVETTDTEKEALYLANKCVQLRVFEDEDGKMNRSLFDTGGAILAVSNFTLCGDCRKGRRPNFTDAARLEIAKPLYELFLLRLKQSGILVESGEFGADMKIDLTCDGPVTLILDTKGITKI